MASASVKIAVSLPRNLHRALEKSRRRAGKSRSAIVQEAIRHWLRDEAEAGRVREYEAGYRKTPEEPPEIRAAEAAAVRLFAETEW